MTTTDERHSIGCAGAAEYTRALTAGYAASTVKNDAREGIDAEQGVLARAWKRAALDLAEFHVRRFVQIANIGAALGPGGGLRPVEAAARAAAAPDPDPPELDAGFDAVFRRLRERAEPWPSTGQVAGGVDAMPVVVDGAAALDRVLELLAVPAPDLGPRPDGPVTRDTIASGTAPRLVTLLGAVHQATVVLADRALDPDQALDSDRARDGGSDLAAITARLLASALRPLTEAIGLAGATADAEATLRAPVPDLAPLRGTATADLLLDLADQATAIVGQDLPAGPGASGLLECTATLQELAVRTVTDGSGPDRSALRARWWAAASDVAPTVRVARNGPYLAVGVREVVDHLGSPVAAPETVSALCRCGRSSLKPRCDGTHARVEFTGDKDPRRVPDRRGRHAGLQVDLLDNRGTCAHSGFCTTRLPVVFRRGKEPFVAASGGRMDEIVRAVRDCPSGALSFEIENREAREQVDWSRDPGIEVSLDGPYRVTGGIALQDGEGLDEHRNEGASHEHYSLCRCGQSQNKPFCSGMHWYVNFADPVPNPDEVPTVFQWVGGLPALRRLTRLFYEKHIPQDPLLAPVFAEMSTDHPERVAKWLGEVFGGPKYFTDEFGGYSRMISQHIGKGLTEAQRSRWAALMVQSANDAELPADAEFRAAFVSYVEWGSRLAVENSRTDAAPPPNMPVPQWWWACNATPLARVSALAPRQEEAVVELPGREVELSFAAHVKPLFRAMDRNSMKFVFDLWDVGDVTTHADAILHRLQEGTMPCDHGWPAERVEVFRRWSETGKAP